MKFILLDNPIRNIDITKPTLQQLEMVTPIIPITDQESSSRARIRRFFAFILLFLVFSSYPIVGLIIANDSAECDDPDVYSHPDTLFSSFNEWMIAICSLCIAQKFFWAASAIFFKPFDFTQKEYDDLSFSRSIYAGVVLNYAPTIINTIFFPGTFGLWVIGIVATDKYGSQCRQLYPMAIAIFVIMSFEFVFLTFIGCIHVFIKTCGGACVKG